MRNKKINPLYFDRDMVISYEKLKSIIESYLKKGFEFGSVKECIENPNKYFCLSFDDGFKEHLWAVKDLVKSYNIKKESLLFAINVGNSIYHKFSGMDIIYYIIQSKRLKEAFEFFNLKMTNNNIFSNIYIFKENYMKQPPNILLDFYNAFSPDLNLDFLDIKDIQDISKITTICSCGITHRNLTYHKEDSNIEIIESKNILEKIINDKISVFVYPEGKSDNDLYEFCKNHKYKYCLSIVNKKYNNFCIGRKDVKSYGYHCN